MILFYFKFCVIKRPNTTTSTTKHFLKRKEKNYIFDNEIYGFLHSFHQRRTIIKLTKRNEKEKKEKMFFFFSNLQKKKKSTILASNFIFTVFVFFLLFVYFHTTKNAN